MTLAMRYPKLLRFGAALLFGIIAHPVAALTQPARQNLQSSAACVSTRTTFDTNTTNPWQLRVNGVAQAVAFSRDNGLVVTIGRAGDRSSDVALTHAPLSLKPFTHYGVSAHVRHTVNLNAALSVAANGSGVAFKPLVLSLLRTEYDEFAVPEPGARNVFVPFSTSGDAGNVVVAIELGDAPGGAELIFDDIEICEMPVQFQDEFDGSALDLNAWAHCRPFTEYCADSGWIETSSWDNPDNVSVADGTMRMRLNRNPKTICFGCQFDDAPKQFKTFDNAGTYIQTNRAFTTKYGYFESRIKLPVGRGLWPAFWLVPRVDEQYGNWSWPPEIDIFEYLSYNRARISQTYHYAVYNENGGALGQVERVMVFPYDMTESFHTFAINWTPEQIVWYIDGVETFRSSRDTAPHPIDQDMMIIVNLVSGGLAGPSDFEPQNVEMQVDNVRVLTNQAFGTLNDNPAPANNPVNPVAGNRAPNAIALASEVEGASPLGVQFNSDSSSDPEGDRMTFEWTFGDGGRSDVANPYHVFRTAGDYQVTLVAKDARGALSIPAHQTIYVRDTTVSGEIQAPFDGQRFSVGEQLTLRAQARNALGQDLPDSAFRWRVLLHRISDRAQYSGRAYELFSLTGNNLTTPPLPQVETLDEAQFSYVEVQLTIVEPGGASRTFSRNVRPLLIAVTYASEPLPMLVRIQQKEFLAPVIFTGWAGMRVQLDTPFAQTGMLTGQKLVFDRWSQEGDRVQTVQLPAQNATYTAHFKSPALAQIAAQPDEPGEVRQVWRVAAPAVAR